MTLWEQCKQAATNVCFRREPNADDPWRMLAAAVIIQSLLDDNAAVRIQSLRADKLGDSYNRTPITDMTRIDDNVYQLYADAIGIECDYISLLQSFVASGQHQQSATAWLDNALKKCW